MVKRALVPGGSGFIGRHMVPALEHRGYEVTSFDIKPEGGGTDARDYFRHADEPFDLCVQLAAVVGGRATIEGAPMDLAVDLSLDAEAFNWALRTGCKKFVYFSSSAAYPVHLQTRETATKLCECMIDLDDVRTPDAIYGWIKLTGEQLAAKAAGEGLDTLVLRPMSGYGPDQDLTYPFSSFVARAKAQEDPFTIWGDGTQVRDWMHISDVVNATLTAVEQGVEGPVNLGTGIGTSFNDLAEMVCTAAGYNPDVRHILDAPQGVHTRVADVTKLSSFFSPAVSLEQGISEALA